MFNFVGNFLSGISNQYFSYSQVQEEIRIDFANHVLPREVILEIFSYLSGSQLRNCFVNRTWKALANDENLWNAVILREKAFGKKRWETYFGEVGKEPPLPKDILKILESPCRFFPGNKVRETHILVLIPETVNGKPLDLTLLGELVKNPKEGKATQYEKILDEIVNDKEINRATVKSHWALLTRDVIPGSRMESYRVQKDMIDKVARETGMNYEVPIVLDAAVCIFMYHIWFRERLFSYIALYQFSTFTRCQERSRSYRVIVGKFSLSGLDVRSFVDNNYSIGVAALLRFF